MQTARFCKKKISLDKHAEILHQVYDAVDSDSKHEIVTVYTDFSKVFDRVPRPELLKKVASIVVGGCLMEVLFDYLTYRKQCVGVDNVCSETLDITSGVQQDSPRSLPIMHAFLSTISPKRLFSENPFFFERFQTAVNRKSLLELSS